MEEGKEPVLTRKEKRFVEEYCIDMNATRSAKAAGYSPVSAYELGSRLLRKVEIKKAIDKRLDEFTMSANEAMRRLTDWGRGSLEPFMIEDKEEGLVISLKKKTAKSHIHLLKKIKQQKRVVTFKSNPDMVVTEYFTELEIIDPKDAVIQIARIRGLYKDSEESNNKITLVYEDLPLPKQEGENKQEQ